MKNNGVEQLNILGIDFVYVIMSHDTQSSEVFILDECFLNCEEAETNAIKHEIDNNYQFYTTIHKVQLK